MSKANKCDRCGTCFDPMSGNGQNEMAEPDETDGTDRILFEDKRDAEKVLTLLKDLIRTYGSATRMDLNEFAHTSNFNSKFIDSLYGWRNLDDAKVIGTFTDKKEPVWQLTLPWAQLLTDKQQGGDFDGDD